jgi:hypothetical protein
LTFYRILMSLTSQNHSLETIFFCWLTYTYSTTSLLACSTYSILSATAGLRLLATDALRLLPKIHLATRSTRSELSIPVQKVKVTLRLTVGQSVLLGVEPLVGLMIGFLSYPWQVRCLPSWVALSDEKSGLSFVEKSQVSVSTRPSVFIHLVVLPEATRCHSFFQQDLQIVRWPFFKRP